MTEISRRAMLGGTFPSDETAGSTPNNKPATSESKSENDVSTKEEKTSFGDNLPGHSWNQLKGAGNEPRQGS